MKNWSQLILQKMPDKISASQFLLVLLTLDSNLYHIFYTISFYTIIVQKNRTLFHKLFPPLSHRNVALSFCPFILASSLMQCYSIVNNFSGGNTMIDKKLIPVKGLKKEPFSGSHFVLTIQKKTFSYLYIRSHGHLKRHQTNKKHRIHFP